LSFKYILKEEIHNLR